MRLSRDAWLGAGVLTLLALVIVLVGLQQSNAPTIPYLSTSSAPNGTLALKLWLEELKYIPQTGNLDLFEVPSKTKIIFILEPLISVNAVEWPRLNAFVQNGGVLVLAGSSSPANSSMRWFDVQLRLLPQRSAKAEAPAPLFRSPAMGELTVNTDYYLYTERSDATPLFQVDGQPVMLTFTHGKGRVILASTAYPFSNYALKENEESGALILNLLAFSGGPAPAWLDDWHHGVQKSAVVGPEQWLRQTPGGHAILFAFGVVFLALLLRGRAFGRYVPLPNEIKRRGPMEHVSAIANLNRKARHRREALAQYHQRLKRQLGRRYRLDPSLPDAEYAKALAQYNSAINEPNLLNLLKRLSATKVSEAELVKLAAEAAEWMKE